jgi:16S rRNA G1207 methylase RsmC
MPTTTINPASLVHATEKAARDAAAAYEKAQSAATEAQRVATEAQTKAEQERHQRRTAYLAELTRTHATNRDSLTTAIGAAREDLEAAVAGDGASVFATYLAWTRRVAELHAVDVEIAEVRGTLGQSSRYPSDIQFSWQHDIGGIVDRLALEAVDDALGEARDRRAAFMNGAPQ